MAWLQISPNTRVTLKLLEGIIHERRQHWVDRSSKDCAGEGCVYCGAGSVAKVRFYMNVSKDGSDFTWEFPGGVRDQLVNLLGGPDKIQGATVTVLRAGAGLETRYVIESVAGAGVAVPAQPALRGSVPGGVGSAVGGPAALGAEAGVHWREELLGAIWGQLTSEDLLGLLAKRMVHEILARNEGSASVADVIVEKVFVGLCADGGPLVTVQENITQDVAGAVISQLEEWRKDEKAGKKE